MPRGRWSRCAGDGRRGAGRGRPDPRRRRVRRHDGDGDGLRQPAGDRHVAHGRVPADPGPAAGRRAVHPDRGVRVARRGGQRHPGGARRSSRSWRCSIRPAAVAMATWRSAMPLRERAFVAWMAPRGIVAGASASAFGLQLRAAGIAGADVILPIVFVAIFATVVAVRAHGPAGRASARGGGRGGGVVALVVGGQRLGARRRARAAARRRRRPGVDRRRRRAGGGTRGRAGGRPRPHDGRRGEPGGRAGGGHRRAAAHAQR